MKKILYFVIFSSVIFAGLYFLWAYLFSDADPGYVLIGVGFWSLETSLAIFTATLWFCFFILYTFFRFLGWLSRIPGKAKSKAKNFHVNRSQNALVSGLIDVAEGNWERAEKILIKHAVTSATPLIHYLTAARAAQSRGAIEQRDKHLEQANKKLLGSEITIGLTHAELCLAEQQHQQALKILKRLYAIDPKQIYVLKLLHQVYMQLGDWNAVKALMLDLNKNQLLSKTDLFDLQFTSYSQLLSNAGKHGDNREVEEIWNAIDEDIQQNNAIETAFYKAMIRVGAGNQVEQDITLSLAKDWNKENLILFGHVESADNQKQLTVAEQWADLHPKDSVMMEILGKLQIKAGDFQQAETSLRKCLSLAPSVTAYQLLGELMLKKGHQEQAIELFKKALVLTENEKIKVSDLEPITEKKSFFPVMTPASADYTEPSRSTDLGTSIDITSEEPTQVKTSAETVTDAESLVDTTLEATDTTEDLPDTNSVELIATSNIESEFKIEEYVSIIAPESTTNTPTPIADQATAINEFLVITKKDTFIPSFVQPGHEYLDHQLPLTLEPELESSATKDEPESTNETAATLKKTPDKPVRSIAGTKPAFAPITPFLKVAVKSSDTPAIETTGEVETSTPTKTEVETSKVASNPAKIVEPKKKKRFLSFFKT